MKKLFYYSLIFVTILTGCSKDENELQSKSSSSRLLDKQAVTKGSTGDSLLINQAQASSNPISLQVDYDGGGKYLFRMDGGTTVSTISWYLKKEPSAYGVSIGGEIGYRHVVQLPNPAYPDAKLDPGTYRVYNNIRTYAYPSDPVTIVANPNIGQSGRHALMRYYNGEKKRHLFTGNWEELASIRYGYVYENNMGYLSNVGGTGLLPLYRYRSGTDYYLTTFNGNINNYVNEGVQGYISTSPASGLKPLYVYNKPGVEHLFTTNYSELGGGANGYVYEGIIGYLGN